MLVGCCWVLDLSRGYSMYAAVRRGAAHRGRSPCTPLEDSGQNADGPSSPHLDTLPLSPRWPRGAEFMGSNRLAGEPAPQTWIPLPLLRIQLLNVATAAFLPSIGRREDRNNIFDFFETILVFLVVKCRLFLEVIWGFWGASVSGFLSVL